MKLEIWNIPYTNNYKKDIYDFTDNCEIYIFVYSIDGKFNFSKHCISTRLDRSSFECIEPIIEVALAVSLDAQVYIVGNKIDIESKRY